MRIDENFLEIFILGKVFGERVEIDDHQTDVQTNLGGSQSDTLTIGQRLPHVLYQLRQLRIVERDVDTFLAQTWLAIYINR